MKFYVSTAFLDTREAVEIAEEVRVEMQSVTAR